MKRQTVWLSILIFLVFSPVIVFGDSDLFDGFSDKEIEKLENGELLVVIEPEDDNPGRVFRAVFLIEKPIDTCWELLNQPERQDEFTTRLEECELVGEGQDTKVVRFLLKVLFMKVRYQIEHIFDDEIYQVDFSLDPEYENDLTIFDGTWRLYPVEEGGTFARYHSRVQLASWIPTLVQRFLTRLSIPAALEAWKTWLDSDGRWRKKK